MKLPINNKRFIYFSQVKTSEKTYTQEFVLDEENKLVAIKRTSGDSCAVYPLVRKEMADKIVYKTSIGEYVIFTKDGNVFGEGYYETDIDGLNDIINSDFIEKTYIFDINGNVQKEVIRSSTNIITTTTINNDGSESFVADDGKSTIRTITKYGDNPLEFILSAASIENGNSGFKEAGAIKDMLHMMSLLIHIISPNHLKDLYIGKKDYLLMNRVLELLILLEKEILVYILVVLMKMVMS